MNMAIDIKEILVNSLLDLIETTPLESISIRKLLEHSKISRQTFYNHFLDKNDLIQYIYDKYIVPDFDHNKEMSSFHDSLLESFKNMKKYKKFLMQACKSSGQNCLKDYILKHCEEYDLAWHQSFFENQIMSDELKFATIYHANASSAMTLSWILSGMVVDEEEIVDMICSMRSIGMKELFKDVKNHPYK